MIEVTKHIEIDAGHRVPDHESKCRSPHGHRYKIEAAITGPVLEHGPETGMVIDFGRLKELLVEHVHDPWDHAMLVYENDSLLLAAMTPDLVDEWTEPNPAIEPWKIDVLSLVPTAENLARIAAERLLPAIREWHRGLELVRVTVWETPTCSATWRP